MKQDETKKDVTERITKAKFPKLKFTIIRKEGYCYHDYDVGDEFILDDFTHPPRHFCAGLLKSAFPCMYALTFGGEFRFMDNTRSIKATCPDNGKLEFKIEVLDDEGNVVVKLKPQEPVKPNPKKMTIEVQDKCGHCFFGYEKGDTFEVTGLKTPADFCGAAYSALFPVLFALNFDGSFSFEDDPVCKTGITCPDSGNIVFKVKRQK